MSGLDNLTANIAAIKADVAALAPVLTSVSGDTTRLVADFKALQAQIAAGTVTDEQLQAFADDLAGADQSIKDAATSATALDSSVNAADPAPPAP